MVVRGLRKKYNNDPERQQLSIDEAERRRRKAWEDSSIRYSISWYDRRSDTWLEVQAKKTFLSDVVLFFSVHKDAPIRTTGYVRHPDPNDRTISEDIEKGFIADGLSHHVWTGGGALIKHREFMPHVEFEPGKSKIGTYQLHITQLGELPFAFRDIYNLRISLPQIQRAIRQYERRQERQTSHPDRPEQDIEVD